MTHTSPTETRNWYAIHYSDLAPTGLPPVIQADYVIRYRDQTHTWVAALWHTTADAPANCILRVADEHISAITRHSTLARAAAHLN